MRRTLPLLAALLICAVSANVFTQDKGDKKDKAKPTRVPVCPLVKMMDHGSYCSYYAVECPTQVNPTTMLNKCDVQVGCSSSNGCIERFVPEGEENKARAKGEVEPGLAKNGNEGKGAMAYDFDSNPMPLKGKMKKKKLATKYKLTKKNHEVIAQLFLIEASKGPDFPHDADIAYGHEVNSTTEPLEPATNVDRVNNHCHRVTVGGVEYTVTTHKNSPHDM